MIGFKSTLIGFKTSLFEIENLDLFPGNLYLLAGKNGTGKTTFLKTIMRTVPLHGGSIQIKGTDLKIIESSTLPLLVAFVESRFVGIPFLSLKEYIALGRAPHTNAFGRLTPKDNEKVDEVISLLNLSSYQDKFTDELSDGIRQLGAIARALVQEAPILLLDEPTAFLDFENKDLLMRTLKEIAVSQNKCIICSSHDLDLSIELALPTLAVSSEENKLILLDSPLNKQQIIGLIC